MRGPVRTKGAKRFTYPVDFSDHEDVASWAEGLPESFAMCRDMGHTWRPHTARYDSELYSYTRVLRCPRCRTEREQTLGGTGLILSNRYIYPDGYQTPAGSGHIDQAGRGLIRLASTMRQLKGN